MTSLLRKPAENHYLRMYVWESKTLFQTLVQPLSTILGVSQYPLERTMYRLKTIVPRPRNMKYINLNCGRSLHNEQGLSKTKSYP